MVSTKILEKVLEMSQIVDNSSPMQPPFVLFCEDKISKLIILPEPDNKKRVDFTKKSKNPDNFSVRNRYGVDIQTRASTTKSTKSRQKLPPPRL